MLRSEAITIIKRGLGFRQTQDTAIIAALQSQQRILERGRTLPEWLLVYDAPIAVTADVADVTLPTNFLRFHDDYQLYYVNSDNGQVFLPRKNYTEAYEAYVASGEADDSAVVPTSSYPQVFVARGKSAGLLIPTPTVSFMAYLTYYKSAAVLDSETTNEWLTNAPDYLVGRAGRQVAMNLRDKDAVATFTDMTNEGGKSFLGDVIEDELAGRPLMMGRNN